MRLVIRLRTVQTGCRSVSDMFAHLIQMIEHVQEGASE